MYPGDAPSRAKKIAAATMQPVSMMPQCRFSMSTTRPPPMFTTPNPTNRSASSTVIWNVFSPKCDEIEGIITGTP